MLAKIPRINIPHLQPYIIMVLIFASFLKDWGLVDFSSETEHPYSPQIYQTIQDLNKNCNHFSSGYCISAKLSSDRVFLILLDFKNWIIYQRSYGKEDIGLQINRKIDLLDIINVLKRQRQNIWDYYYVFGATEKSLQQEPLFMVENGGILTIFVEVITKSSSQYAQSELHLIKMKDMNQLQIFNVKLQIQKMEMMKKFNTQLSKLRIENERLEKKINQLNKCNCEKEQVTKMKTGEQNQNISNTPSQKWGDQFRSSNSSKCVTKYCKMAKENQVKDRVIFKTAA